MGSGTAPAACCSACSESPAPIRRSDARPPRRRGGSERTITLAAIGVAGAFVGAALATMVVGPPAGMAFLFGFLSLVIAGSLLHLLPTVVGARIRRTGSSIVAFTGLALGPAVVTLGFAIARIAARAGGRRVGPRRGRGPGLARDHCHALPG